MSNNGGHTDTRRLHWNRIISKVTYKERLNSRILFGFRCKNIQKGNPDVKIIMFRNSGNRFGMIILHFTRFCY